MVKEKHYALIAEDFAGMRSQALGLLERLGGSWEFYAVKVKSFSLGNFLPVSLWFSPLAYCEDIHLSDDVGYLISVGGKGGAVARALGKKYSLPFIQIQDPRHKRKDFPVIIAPSHDGLKGENIFSLPHALHPITEEKLIKAREKWNFILKKDKNLLFSVLLGGGNGRYYFTLKEAENIAQKIILFLQKYPSISCWVTASRRTNEVILNYLKERLAPLGVYFWDATTGGENPYLGLLACADIIAVTEESVSMISEAIATTAPVMILPLRGYSRRIKNFNTVLKEKGRVWDFDEILTTKKDIFTKIQRLDETGKALSFIEERVFFTKK